MRLAVMLSGRHVGAVNFRLAARAISSNSGNVEEARCALVSVETSLFTALPHVYKCRFSQCSFLSNLFSFCELYRCVSVFCVIKF